MEVDKILYIFGSFTRKKSDKDKRKSLDPSSISAGNSPLHLNKTQHRFSQNIQIAPRTSAYEEVRSRKEWECGLCKKELVEPRLLGCLHTFCTPCLQGLPQEGDPGIWSELDGGSIQLDAAESGSGSGNGSAASGYESDLRHSGSEGSWEKNQKFGFVTRKISGKSVQFLLCPTCGYETQLPLGGISALPLNYVLLRKMVASGQEDRISVLCDLCNSDNKAESRCNQCLVSVCESCGAAHARTRATSRHALRPLRPAPTHYCPHHERAELTVYCATCQQVICRDCCIISHSGHALASAARAAAERARALRDACDLARSVPATVAGAVRQLDAQAQEDDLQAARVESEIATWSAQYRRAVESHTRAVSAAAARARARGGARAAAVKAGLIQRASQAEFAVGFAEELLCEGRPPELLALSPHVVRRLQRVAEPVAPPPPLALRFSPGAPAGVGVLAGRLLTTTPDPERCVLDVEGLQDMRVDVPHEAVLELRDSSGERVWSGGEQVAGYFRRRDSRARPLPAGVSDRADGSYGLSVRPRSPGAYFLAVTVDNKPIKGSPFPCAVRAASASPLKKTGSTGTMGKSGALGSHVGRYHCCAYCSSGGARAATCACTGAGGMPGYRGCGHGHSGWPGARHWSCCGSTQRAAPCTNPTPTNKLYQFSL